MMGSRSVRKHVEFFTKIKLRNSESLWLLIKEKCGISQEKPEMKRLLCRP